MGCDIHFVVEKKYEEKWVGVYAPYTTPAMQTRSEMRDKPADYIGSFTRVAAFKDRHYAFFALLAGVRGDGPEPVGKPDDCSELAQLLIDEYGGDGHSHSWLPYREFCNRHALATGSVFTDGGDKEYLSGLHESEYAGYRVVFWFDN